MLLGKQKYQCPANFLLTSPLKGAWKLETIPRSWNRAWCLELNVVRGIEPGIDQPVSQPTNQSTGQPIDSATQSASQPNSQPTQPNVILHFCRAKPQRLASQSQSVEAQKPASWVPASPGEPVGCYSVPFHRFLQKHQNIFSLHFLGRCKNNQKCLKNNRFFILVRMVCNEKHT